VEKFDSKTVIKHPGTFFLSSIDGDKKSDFFPCRQLTGTNRTHVKDGFLKEKVYFRSKKSNEENLYENHLFFFPGMLCCYYVMGAVCAGESQV
jgi:hypothetical protein